ncbi:MAG: hypothetical protein ACKV2T_15145 [Kofleriaceae bacterium]
MVKVLAIITTLAACTYSPNLGDCRVATCESAADCPEGFTCSLQYCRAPGATLPCEQVLVDARQSDAPLGSDGTSGTCVGTASACPTYQALQTCNMQSGCTWVAPSCTVTTNCSMYMTNTACMQHDECRTDFMTSTCVKNTSYCSGSTEPTCEDVPECVFAGGCGGTADPCNAFTSEAACGTQMGCSWQ